MTLSLGQGTSYLMNGAPIAIPAIWNSSERLLVVPSASDVGVWSLVRIMTMLRKRVAPGQHETPPMTPRHATHENARLPRRDMNRTKLIAIHSPASARALRSGPVARARTLRSGRKAKVSGQVRSVKRKTCSASMRRRNMGSDAFSKMDTKPMMDNAPAILRGCRRVG